jgi:hypothetical protein
MIMVTIGLDIYINEKEASTKYGFSISWFRKNRFSKHKIPYHKLNGKVYFKPNELEAWFKSNFKAM